ncbi:MAG: hypothetical protein JWN31_314 [Frankiales bacterium]|nr:hypothetical protein [Frankiales bacterium]
MQVGLIAVATIPVVAGTLRLVEVFGGPRSLPHNPRIAASPAPVVIHIVGGGLFLLLGAFQFSAQLRRRNPNWHRRAGRVLMVLGLGAALAALWMTLLYPRQTGTGELLYLFRLAFGSAMAASIALAFQAIRRGDVTQHRAWMTRAYALALGAGTQTFTIGVGQGIFGKTVLSTDLSTAAGWIINLTVAEYLIRRPLRRRGRGQITVLASTAPAPAKPRSMAATVNEATSSPASSYTRHSD